MNTIDVKRLVEQSVRQEWPAFVESHPRLAQVLDEELILEHVTETLADDPEYQEAMANAAGLGLAAEVLGELAGKFVRRFLNKLV